MDQKITWSLIIAGVIVIAGAAIWGIWSLLKGNQDPEMKKKLRKELNEIVDNASVEAIDAFISQKSNTFIADATTFNEVKKDVTLTATADEITARKTELKRSYTAPDQVAKIDDVDKGTGGTGLKTAKANIDAAIEKEAKEITKNLISKKIKNMASCLCEKEAKSATDNDIYNLVEQGSNVDKAAKDKIKEKANQEATKKVTEIISDAVWGTIRTAVQTEGNNALKAKLTEITKNKNDLIDQAILNVAGVAKKA